MSDAMLEAAGVTVEVQPDAIHLWLPGTRKPLRLAVFLWPAFFASALGGKVLGGLWLLLALAVPLLVGMGVLVVNGLRWRQAAPRERLTLTPHAVLAPSGPVDLSAIRDLWVLELDDCAELIARTAEEEVVLTTHRSTWALEAIRPTVRDHVRRRRAQLLAAGVDPDDPERIPAALQQMRSGRLEH